MLKDVTSASDLAVELYRLAGLPKGYVAWETTLTDAHSKIEKQPSLVSSFVLDALADIAAAKHLSPESQQISYYAIKLLNDIANTVEPSRAGAVGKLEQLMSSAPDSYTRKLAADTLACGIYRGGQPDELTVAAVERQARDNNDPSLRTLMRNRLLDASRYQNPVAAAALRALEAGTEDANTDARLNAVQALDTFVLTYALPDEDLARLNNVFKKAADDANRQGEMLATLSRRATDATLRTTQLLKKPEFLG